ncbi:hypothetical protein Agub_g13063, partial [Astrephomene gubernaculifera]
MMDDDDSREEFEEFNEVQLDGLALKERPRVPSFPNRSSQSIRVVKVASASVLPISSSHHAALQARAPRTPSLTSDTTPSASKTTVTTASPPSSVAVAWGSSAGLIVLPSSPIALPGASSSSASPPAAARRAATLS